jgi:hypothetical protein
MRVIGLAVVLIASFLLAPLAAEANPFHNRLVALSEAERHAVFNGVLADERCVVIRTFFQGFDKDRNAYWSVGCRSRGALQVMIRNDASGSTRVLECSTLRVVARVECFKTFSEQR